jgi:hypothetical protein
MNSTVEEPASNSNSNNSKMGMGGGRRRGTRKGSRRATRKMSGGKRKASPWNKMVKSVFDEMRRKNKSASFGDALKEASRRKKRGSK